MTKDLGDEPSYKASDRAKTAVQHTPGPWRFGRTSVPVMIIGGPAERYVASVQIHQIGGGFLAQSMEAERWANAHLVVAAPALHDALAQCVAFLESIEGVGYGGMAAYDGPLGLAHAALASAAGQPLTEAGAGRLVPPDSTPKPTVG